MKTFGLIGYGKLGKQIESMILEISKEKIAFVYFDDPAYQSKIKSAFPFKRYLDDEFQSFYFVLCLGYKHLNFKEEILKNLLSNKRMVPSIIHPTSFISPECITEDGVIVYPMCNVDRHVYLKSGVFLNNSVTISHDSVIGSCSFLAPGVILSGDVHIGARSFLGSNTSIANSLHLGSDTVAGIGSVITKSFPKEANLFGNPAKQLSRKIKLL